MYLAGALISELEEAGINVLLGLGLLIKLTANLAPSGRGGGQ
jgi:hypothetical protein